MRDCSIEKVDIGDKTTKQQQTQELETITHRLKIFKMNLANCFGNLVSVIVKSNSIWALTLMLLSWMRGSGYDVVVRSRSLPLVRRTWWPPKAWASESWQCRKAAAAHSRLELQSFHHKL